MSEQELKEEKYYLNDKIYNISKSKKLYEYIERESTGMMFMGSLKLTREVIHKIYESSKGNLFKTRVSNGRINIVDLNDNGLKDILLSKNELELLKRIYPDEMDLIEEY